MSNKILDSNQINQKIKRLSYEIYENNLEEKKNNFIWYKC